MKIRTRPEVLSQIQIFSSSVKLLLETGHTEAASLLIAQMTEVSGCLLDTKPVAAPAQGFRRFTAAVFAFLPATYHPFASKLYKQWRCHSIHSLIPGKFVAVTDKADLHLKENEDVLYIDPARVFKDLMAGMNERGFK